MPYPKQTLALERLYAAKVYSDELKDPAASVYVYNEYLRWKYENQNFLKKLSKKKPKEIPAPSAVLYGLVHRDHWQKVLINHNLTIDALTSIIINLHFLQIGIAHKYKFADRDFKPIFNYEEYFNKF